jgi:hypothetical protein
MSLLVKNNNYILNADGEPELCEDIYAWGMWFERTSRTRERVVAQDKHESRTSGEPEIMVSTVFLALDHNWGDGPPVLWETLVFGGLLDGEMNRYTSRADALAGHQAMCRRVIESLG